MKGLLIKDWKLLKRQGKFFLCILGIALIYVFFTDSMLFGIVYSTVLLSTYAVTTITYDEYNNGMAFLFTLPVSRKGYVVEKYLFGVIAILGSEVALIIVNSVLAFVKNGGGLSGKQIETICSAGLGGAAAVLVLMSVMIPVQLKWGAKKGQVAWIAIFLGVAVIIGVMVKLSDIVDINFDALIGFVNQISAGWIIVAVVVLLAAGFLISCRISIGIMEKKEF